MGSTTPYSPLPAPLITNRPPSPIVITATCRGASTSGVQHQRRSVPVADDDVRVEVRATDRGRRAWRWEATWRPARRLEAGSRVTVRLPQSGNAAVACSLVRQP